ncbi:MAG TPA: NAD(P)/FAD-dependent oxidoreductase [Nitrososphaeraceae archaeon]|jgi:NADH dehydrogenase|nr:NAD(P)/FAD-dependent oxidoreductase [Nitrososphaeraceae archaeon]
MNPKLKAAEARIDFSFKREVFFIVAGGIMGAIVMAIPFTFPFTGRDSGYALTWIVFGHIVGVYSPISSVIIAGIVIHLVTGISIGVVSGVFLYKTNILNISKPSNGLRYGLFVGTLVYLIFAIPVQQFVLNPEFRHTSSNTDNLYKNNINGSSNTVGYKEEKSSTGQIGRETEETRQIQRPNNIITTFSNIQLNSTIYSILINLLFGITLGLFSSYLSIKFGSRYRCPECDISFSRIDILQSHLQLVHGDKPMIRKRIVILGGGFAGVSVLKRLQSKFQSNVGIEITMVSKDNYMLFTPMLHEVASGMIETRHIVTPIRAFCNRSRFYSALVENIDLENRQVLIRYSTSIDNTDDRSIADDDILESNNTISLYYDYLVIALGCETKFFGMSDVQQNAFTIKSLDDAINLRNHIIYLLEESDQLPVIGNNNNAYNNLQKKLLTFVIVGGGFAGVETAGEINDFIKDSAKDYYHNINLNDIGIILIQSGDRLLPEMSKELAKFALKKLSNSGVEVIFNTRVVGATSNNVKLGNGTIIPTKTIVWSGGVSPNSLIANLTCEHDKSGRIVVDKFLEIPQSKGVYALGDCAYIIDPNTGKPYPPTAQHAIREGAIVAKNIIAAIEGRLGVDYGRVAFNYKTKGMMASIGKRTGIGNLLGIEVQGFLAWWIWRNYYLANLPTFQKKIRVMSDWMLDMFFKRDVTMFRTFVEEKERGIKTKSSSFV